MLGFFNKKSELLPNFSQLAITWYYKKEILLEIKVIALEIFKLLPEHPNLLYMGEKVSQKELFKRMDKDINNEECPDIRFEFKDINLYVLGSANFYNHNACKTKTFLLNIIYDNEIFNPSTYFEKLSKYGIISKILTNSKFDSKQREYRLSCFTKKELNNKLLYPGYNNETDEIYINKNPGYSELVVKFGLIGVGCYNEYSRPLVESFGNNVIENALKKLKLSYKWEDEYLKFSLFDDHRKSEFPENIKLLVNFKKEINFDKYLEEQAKDLESDEIINNYTENNMSKNKMIEDLKASAEWIVERFNDMNIELDYSLDSLKPIDLFLKNEFNNGKPKAGSVVEGNVGGIVFALGSYLGETLIKNSKEGIWIPNPEDADDEINISIEINKRFVAWPMQKVIKNIKNANEISIYEYAKQFLDYKK